MDQFSVGSRTERCEERLSRLMALAVSRGDRVAIHSVRDRINAERRWKIEHPFTRYIFSTLGTLQHNIDLWYVPRSPHALSLGEHEAEQAAIWAIQARDWSWANTDVHLDDDC